MEDSLLVKQSISLFNAESLMGSDLLIRTFY